MDAASTTLCLHQVFEEQARRAPASIAVVCGEERLSYGELNRRANRLAHNLIGLGVGPESLVGLCAEPSLWMLTALLGILKAGGAYVPLDPKYPRQRLAYLLSMTRVPVVVSVGEAAAVLPAHTAREVRLNDSGVLDRQPETNPACVGVTDDNLAYVIHTSGSTGAPKGVMVCHRQVHRLFTAMAAELAFDDSDVFTVFHSLAFDFSVWEIWGALLHGGRVVIVPPEVARSPSAFLRLLASEKVTILSQTPTAFRSLMRAAASCAPPLPSLRGIVFGGEALNVGILGAWAKLYGVECPRLVNMYGITETTVHVTSRVLAADDLTRAGVSPIGRPLADLRLHLLNESMRPVAAGSPGEIYVGGAGLARGYLAQPGLTAERFLPEPFGGVQGARMYQTGDLARQLPNGDFEYLGRNDEQLKVRGFRIEPGEVESALLQHSEVSDAVVTIRENAEGERRLVAYVVPTGAAARIRLPAALHNLLKETLPLHMLPSSFVMVDEFPHTPNGKLDRAALPTPPTERPELGVSYRGPRDELEQTLVDIWAEIVEVETVGIDDDFFQLGGDSVMAARAAAQAQVRLGSPVPVSLIFAAPAIAPLAERLRELQCETPGRAVGSGGRPPLTPAQQRIWFLHTLNPQHPVNNIPAVLLLNGDLDVAALERSLGEIIDRHESLRTAFPAATGQPFPVVSAQAEVQWCTCDLTGESDPSARDLAAHRLIAEEAERPFDLQSPPLLRATLLRLSERQWKLLLTAHHIIFDGWSLRVLVDELTKLYEAFTLGLPSPLSSPHLQYSAFAAWQRERLRGRVGEELLGYWRERLSNRPHALELPTDHARPDTASFRGAVQASTIAAELASELKKLGRRRGVTLFMITLGAFLAVLAKHSGQTDALVGVPVANRNHPAADGLIGCCFNVLVLRADLAGDPTFGELLARVREATLGALAHQDLPFERLVADLNPQRRPNRHPLFQIGFNFNDAPVVAHSVAGVSFEIDGPPLGEVAKMDLELYVTSQPGALPVQIVHDTALFEAETAARLLDEFKDVLRRAAANPDARLRELLLGGRGIAVMTAPTRARRRRVSVSEERLVREDVLRQDGAGPLLLRPALKDVHLAEWASLNRDYLRSELHRRGAVLFRGFDLPSVECFERFVGSLGDRMVNYVEGSSPRVRVSEKVYTSTEYPAEYPISMHNELSYAHRWPRLLFFYCAVPPREGGETPIADSRLVLERLNPAVRDRFMMKGLRYMRNAHGGPGAGLSWQSIFETTKREVVEGYCREGAIDFEWTEGGLRTRQIRPATALHPETGQRVWFNQADQWHPSNLGPLVKATAREADLPLNATYGDGTELEAEALEEVRDAYRRSIVTFAWKAGDVLLIDNMLTAHGRMPFAGPRKILVAMSGVVSLSPEGRASA